MAAAQHHQHVNIGNLAGGGVPLQEAAQPVLGAPGALAPDQSNLAQAHTGMHGTVNPVHHNYLMMHAVNADLAAAHNQGGGHINLDLMPNAAVQTALLLMSGEGNPSDAANRLLRAAGEVPSNSCTPTAYLHYIFLCPICVWMLPCSAWIAAFCMLVPCRLLHSPRHEQNA